MPKPTALLKGFEKAVATAQPTAKRQVIFDGSTTGLALVVTPKGKRSFSVVARDPSGKQVWKQIGEPGTMTVATAREEAVEAVARVKAGKAAMLPPATPVAAPETFKQVAERFIERHVDKQALRGAYEVKRQFNRYIYPAWESETFTSIRRGKVVELLDGIEDNSGPVMADRVLATLRKMFNWVEVREEEYVSPIVRGMRVNSAKDRARKRVLSDDELRALWTGFEKVGTFGALAKAALLTAQRKAKVGTMRWEDIKDGVWTIPAQAREKVNAGELKLPKMALDLINSQPKIEGNPFVFAGRGKAAFNSFSDGKESIDALVKIEPWRIHDLRRTARSLMARAGVRSDIAERTLGHVIAGVEGVYDRHGYRDEKGDALAALASLVERILSNDEAQIVPIRKFASE